MEIVNELPPEVRLSPYLKEKCERYAVIKYLGQRYYVPLTNEVERILFNQRFKRDADKIAETALRDIISGIYLQLRDDVFGATARKVMDEVTEALAKKMAPALEQHLEQRFSEHEEELLAATRIIITVNPESVSNGSSTSRNHHSFHSI